MPFLIKPTVVRPTDRMPRWSRALFAGLATAALLLWLGVSRFLGSGNPLSGVVDVVASFTTVFLGIFIEAAAFLLLGTLASGLVEVFIGYDQIHRWVPRDPLRGVIVGAMLGLLFPVCECGVVPLTRRLFHKGLPLSTGITFLLAAPVFNPIVIASTIAAFGVGRVLLLRLGLTLLIATMTGLIFAVERRPERLLRPSALAPISGASGEVTAVGHTRGAWRTNLRRAMTVAVDELFEMGAFLVAGALLAALMQTVVPQAALLALGTGPVISVLTLIALAVILSICSTVDAFIALSFAGTFTTGSLLAFLVFGPMVDIKSTLMFLGVFRRRTVAYLVLLPLLMNIVIATFINLNTAW
jgi:uncharacterized membrane protein YraQ (UPF0718 family)